MKLDVEIRGVETLCRQLEALTSDSQDRRALARRMGRKALTLARRRVRKQKNLDGTPFAPRKDKRNKRKLLEWIYSRGVVYGRDDGAKVTFRGKAAEFAFQQQFGVGRDWTPGEIRKARGTPDYQKSASRGQAQELLRLGYRAGSKKTGWRIVSVPWIEKNMTFGTAGSLIALLAKKPPAASWRDSPPARVALGVTDKDAEKLLEQVAKESLKRLQAKGTL